MVPDERKDLGPVAGFEVSDFGFFAAVLEKQPAVVWMPERYEPPLVLSALDAELNSRVLGFARFSQYEFCADAGAESGFSKLAEFRWDELCWNA